MSELETRNPVMGEVESAQTVSALKALTTKLSPLQEYARQAGESLHEINNLAEARVMAMCKGGYILRGLERKQGFASKPLHSLQPAENVVSPYKQELLSAGLGDDTAHRWQIMSWAWKPENLVTPYCHHQREIGRTITSEEVFRIGKKAMPHDIEEPMPIDGKYSVIIIDPPWPMQRIERDEVRPNQAGLDYPVMSEEEIGQLGTDNADIVPNMMEDDCHVFLWTTQKFLPMAQRLFERWGINYVLELVWHKPGGFQPYNLPQYNCEFILYGRKGAPKFVDTTDFFCCFTAPRREHSRKPDEFYDTIQRVTTGKRIEVFAREPRDDYDTWGNQARKFGKEAAE